MNKLYRSKEDRIFAGVAGGAGEYFNTDSTLIRLIFVLITFVTGILPFVLFYIIAALIVPVKGEARSDSNSEDSKDLKENKKWIRLLAILILLILVIIFVLVSVFAFGSIFSILNWGSLSFWEWWLGTPVK